MLEEMGMEAFAERADSELLAARETFDGPADPVPAAGRMTSPVHQLLRTSKRA